MSKVNRTDNFDNNDLTQKFNSREVMHMECEYCGIEFSGRAFRKDGEIYCSRECAEADAEERYGLEDDSEDFEELDGDADDEEEEY